MLSALKKGNARTFAILAERAYGKVTTSVEVNVNANLAERLAAARKRLHDSRRKARNLHSEQRENSGK